MKVELFPFQKRVLADLRLKVGEAIGGFQRKMCIRDSSKPLPSSDTASSIN